METKVCGGMGYAVEDFRLSLGHGDAWTGVPVQCYIECNNPIFFEDSLLPYTFVNFVDSNNYNSAQQREHVAEFQAAISAEASVSTVQLWVHCSRQYDHTQS